MLLLGFLILCWHSCLGVRRWNCFGAVLFIFIRDLGYRLRALSNWRKVRCAAYPKIIFLKLSLVLQFLLIFFFLDVLHFLFNFYLLFVFHDAYFRANVVFWCLFSCLGFFDAYFRFFFFDSPV